MHVYRITNKLNQENYVGATARADYRIRWREHLSRLRRSKHDNRRLQFSWSKYGEENFEFVLLETYTNIEDLSNRETVLISEIGTFNSAKGGNARSLIPEHIEKRKGIGNKPVIGMCVETGEIRRYKRVMDVDLDGFNHKNIGSRCRLTESKNDNRSHKYISTNGWVWMYEKDFNMEEMNRRAQMAKRGKVRLERSVIGKSLVDGREVEYKSSAEASRQENINISSIYQCCVNKKHKTAKCFIWAFKDSTGEDSLQCKWDNYVYKRGPYPIPNR